MNNIDLCRFQKYENKSIVIVQVQEWTNILQKEPNYNSYIRKIQLFKLKKINRMDNIAEKIN